MARGRRQQGHGHGPAGTTSIGPILPDSPEPDRPETAARGVFRRVYDALAQRGYDPIHQLVGYLLSGDPAYITSHGQARNLIRQVGREELLEELVRAFVEAGGREPPDG